MHFIGITGGVGAGKSEILAYLKEKYQAYVLLTDELAHRLMEPGESCYEEIVGVFGREILCEDGRIDRTKMASLVFGRADLLKILNGIVHPAVKKRVLELAEQERQSGRTFFFVEAALLLEEKYDEICDELWYVYTDAKVRAVRLKASRGYSEEKIRGIMAAQLPDEAFREGCDFVLDNSGDFFFTKKQIDDRMERFDP